jgi:hypothetical protein
VFDDWWYLRFLLPGIAMLLVLTVSVVDAIVADANGIRTAVITARRCHLRAVHRRERARNVFDLQRLERATSARDVCRDTLPPNAVVITSWESGSVASTAIARRSCGMPSIPPGSIAPSPSADARL